MCVIATITRPLRSKRAMASPVSPRPKASGFTRIRVLSTRLLSSKLRPPAGARPETLLLARAGGGRLDRLLRRGARARAGGGARGPSHGPARAGAGGGDLSHFGLAVGTYLPARVERFPTHAAGLLEAPQAARTAEKGLLDVEAAVWTGDLLDLPEPRLGRGYLELALADVLQVLGRAHDQVDDGAHEREQGRSGRAAHEHRIGDAPPRVGVGPVDQRDPHHHEEEQQQVDREVQPIVLDAEDREGAHGSKRVYLGGVTGKAGPARIRCRRRRGSPWPRQGPRARSSPRISVLLFRPRARNPATVGERAPGSGGDPRGVRASRRGPQRDRGPDPRSGRSSPSRGRLRPGRRASGRARAPHADRPPSPSPGGRAGEQEIRAWRATARAGSRSG